MRVYLLRDRVSWFGGHTGYEPLFGYVPRSPNLAIKAISPSSSIFPRILGKSLSSYFKHGNVNQSHAYARLLGLIKLCYHNSSVLHFQIGEDHLPFCNGFPYRLLARTVFTFHQPFSQWLPKELLNLKYVKQAIVLYKKDLSLFQSAMPEASITYIPLGVDVKYFHPIDNPTYKNPRRILYNGVHLRNVKMLRRIIPLICSNHQDIKFDFLVPLHRRQKSIFGELLDHPAIIWHSNLDDEQLRLLYQRAYLLLLPMNDSGANTAIVEALASGLPIITCDVGGIRDYGGNSIYQVVANNDDKEMVRLVNHYLLSTELRSTISKNSRALAERLLSWPSIFDRHLDVYRNTLMKKIYSP